MRNLKSVIANKKHVKLLQAHDPISAIVVEQSGFDGVWSSSFGDSTSMAMPDCEFYSLHNRADMLRYMLGSTSKPILMDIDSGGRMEFACLHIKQLEALGISGVVIEDKIGYKRNSLYGKDSGQQQATPEHFAEKIHAISKRIQDPDFLLVSRIESLILGETIDQAFCRAQLYVNSGTNGIMIHSVEKDPEMLLEFVKRFSLEYPTIPLIVVPTTFNKISDSELFDAGVNVIIYANHLIRSAVGAMIDTAGKILENGRTYEVDQQIMSVQEVLKLIPENDPGYRFN